MGIKIKGAIIGWAIGSLLSIIAGVFIIPPTETIIYFLAGLIFGAGGMLTGFYIDNKKSIN